MKTALLAPKGTLEKKPPHGAPCNRCGLCCEAEVCPMGEFVLGQSIGPCPALARDAQGNASCGLIATPEKFVPVRAAIYGRQAMSDAAAHLIGSGTGCDARVNGEPRNE